MAETWDESKPAGSRAPSLGDDDIREFKRAVRERLAEDHDFEATESPAFGASLYTIGKHKFVTLVQRNTSKVTASDEVAMQCKAVSGNPEVIITPPSAGTDRQITKNSCANLNLNSGDFANRIIPANALDTSSIDIAAIPDALITPVKIGGGLDSIFSRPQFAWVDADTITLSHIHLFHSGTIAQLVYSLAQITFNFGPGGSNTNSNTPGNNEWQYLYIDDSALSGGAITAARLINSTTAPVWTPAKLGWYPSAAVNNVQTTDRCLGAFRTNGSAQLIDFHHDGSRFMQYDAPLPTDIGSLGTGPQDVDLTWLDVTGVLPGFCTQGRFWHDVAGVTASASVRVNGSSGNGMVVASTSGGVSIYDMHTDTSQKYEVVHNVSGTSTSEIETIGYYFPTGM